MKPLIIYHNHCADGFTAAWIMYQFHGRDAELYGANYYEPPPDVSGRDVFVVDFHYDRETTLVMKNQATRMVVLDHHRTAEEALSGIHECIFDMNRSGAMLAWDYCKTGFDNDEPPWLVRYVQDRDLWRWELPDSEAINAYVQHQPHTVANWDRMADMEQEQAAAAGRAALTAINSYVESALLMTQMMFVSGHLVPVVNAQPWHTSELLNTLCRSSLKTDVSEGSWKSQVIYHAPLAENGSAPEGMRGYRPPFALSWYVMDDGRVGHSVRSKRQPGHTKSFDVSALAKAWGGGGHREAAGFVLDKPIFEYG